METERGNENETSSNTFLEALSSDRQKFYLVRHGESKANFTTKKTRIHL